MATLARKSDLIPKVIAFLEIILEHSRSYQREELMEKLFEKGIGVDVGNSGRLLSNISQFLTKKTNPHFSQIITFDTGGTTGEVKTNYFVLDEYRPLLFEVLHESKAAKLVEEIYLKKSSLRRRCLKLASIPQLRHILSTKNPMKLLLTHILQQVQKLPG